MPHRSAIPLGIVGSSSKPFDALLLASASIVWWTNADGEFVNEQPYWQAYTGQTWEEYRGSRWTSCLHPDDKASIMEDWVRAVGTGGPYFTEGRIWSAKHQAYRAFQTRGIAVKDENGKIYEWLGALTDVQDTMGIKVLLESTRTDLARTVKDLRLSEAKSQAQAAALQVSEAQLAADLDAMTRLHRVGTLFACDGNLEPVLGEIVDTAIAISKADFGNIQLVDAKSADLRIAAQRGFPGWWIDFWDNAAKGQGTCGTALERGERVIVEDVERSPVFTGPALEIQLKAGVRAVQSTPLMSRAGKCVGMFSTHYKTPQRPDDRAVRLLDLLARHAADIIERAQVDMVIHENNDRLSALMQSTTDAVITVDQGQRIVLFNPAAERMFACPATDAMESPLDRFIPETVRQAHHDHVRKFGTTGITTRRMGALGALSAVRANGEAFPIEASISQVTVGGVKLYTAIVRDITERKLAEDSLRDQAALLELAHDAIIVRGGKDEVTFWNKGAEKTYGWTRDEALGRVTHDLLKTRF